MSNTEKLPLCAYCEHEMPGDRFIGVHDQQFCSSECADEAQADDWRLRAEKAEARVAELDAELKKALDYTDAARACVNAYPEILERPTPERARFFEMCLSTYAPSVCTCSTDAINMCPVCRPAQRPNEAKPCPHPSTDWDVDLTVGLPYCRECHVPQTETALLQEAETRGFRLALQRVTDQLRELRREDPDGFTDHRPWNAALSAVRVWIDRHYTASETGSEVKP